MKGAINKLKIFKKSYLEFWTAFNSLPFSLSFPNISLVFVYFDFYS